MQAYETMLDVSDFVNEVKRDSEQRQIIKENKSKLYKMIVKLNIFVDITTSMTFFFLKYLLIYLMPKIWPVYIYNHKISFRFIDLIYYICVRKSMNL